MDMDTLTGLLEDAWERVRKGSDAEGVDGIRPPTYEDDLTANMAALQADLAAGRYRPQVYRAVDLPKPGGGHRRIVIPAVRDRVAATACLLAIYPAVEPLFHPCSFAYRQKLGVADAVRAVTGYRDRGLATVLRGDIARFFDSVDTARLEPMLASAGVPEELLGLVRAWLGAGAIARGAELQPVSGLPQGLPLSPLLANLYLTPFDRRVVEAGWKLVRYADDFTVCCRGETEAQAALTEVRRALDALGLQLADDKTRTGSFDEGFVFLGCRFEGAAVVPEGPHPYEADFAPPRPPRRPPAQGLPHTLLRTLYIQQQGSTLGCHGGRLVVTREGQTLLDLPAHHVDQVFTFGRVHLTSAAMSFCIFKRIPVHLFSGRGKYYGVLRSAATDGLPLRRAQFTLFDDEARRLDFARAIVAVKIGNCRQLMAHHARNHPETDLAAEVEGLLAAAARAGEAENLAQLRGIEGNAAAVYYGGLARCFRGALTFAHRARRPPTDPVNSLLSFAYTMLFYNVFSYVAARGLDQLVGLFHEPGRGHPALVSDLMEEFRAPVVDALVLAVCNRNEFSQADFYLAPGQPQPCLMQDEARGRFLQAFEHKLAALLQHEDVTHEVDWRRVLDLQVCRFRRFVEGSIDHYEPFRWNP